MGFQSFFLQFVFLLKTSIWYGTEVSVCKLTLVTLFLLSQNIFLELHKSLHGAMVHKTFHCREYCTVYPYKGPPAQSVVHSFILRIYKYSQSES
jgi:hypothetical protein